VVTHRFAAYSQCDASLTSAGGDLEVTCLVESISDRQPSGTQVSIEATSRPMTSKSSPQARPKFVFSLRNYQADC